MSQQENLQKISEIFYNRTLDAAHDASFSAFWDVRKEFQKSFRETALTEPTDETFKAVRSKLLMDVNYQATYKAIYGGVEEDEQLFEEILSGAIKTIMQTTGDRDDSVAEALSRILRKPLGKVWRETLEKSHLEAAPLWNLQIGS